MNPAHIKTLAELKAYFETDEYQAFLESSLNEESIDRWTNSTADGLDKQIEDLNGEYGWIYYLFPHSPNGGIAISKLGIRPDGTDAPCSEIVSYIITQEIAKNVKSATSSDRLITDDNGTQVVIRSWTVQDLDTGQDNITREYTITSTERFTPTHSGYDPETFMPLDKVKDDV